MVQVSVRCRHCQSERVMRYGRTASGKRRYFCNDCKRQSCENPQSIAYSPEDRQVILKAYQERSSLRGLTRVFGVARNTVSAWLKKSTMNSPR